MAQWEWINPYPTGDELNSVIFYDSFTAWAVGDHGTIYRYGPRMAALRQNPDLQDQQTCQNKLNPQI